MGGWHNLDKSMARDSAPVVVVHEVTEAWRVDDGQTETDAVFLDIFMESRCAHEFGRFLCYAHSLCQKRLLGTYLR